MSFWTTVGQVGGGASAAYFRNDLGEKWSRDARKKKASDEVAALKPKAPDASQQAAFDAENSKTAAEDNALINDPAASGDATATPMPERKPDDYQYGVPATAPISEDERYTRMEDIYRRHGFDDRADHYGLRAHAIKRQEKDDARNDKLDANAQQLHDLNVSGKTMQNQDAAEVQAQRKATENFSLAMSTAKANGKPLDFQTQITVAGQYGVNQQNMQAAMLAANNLDKAEFERTRDERVQKASTAAAKGGLNGLLNLYNTDPAFSDGNKVSIARGRDGRVSLLHKTDDGNLLFTSTPMTEQEAVAYAIATLKDPAASLKLHMEIEDHKAKQVLQGAQARAAIANAEESLAKAKAQPELAAARMEAAKGKADNHSKDVNDGVKQIALMHGAKTDTFGAFSFTDIADKAAYSRDIARMEEMVMAGTPPMKAADTIMQGTRKEQTLRTVTANDNPASSSAVSAMRNKLGY